MKKKILLIEDNHEIRDNTHELLEIAGYHVVAAQNGKEGVAAAHQEKPDLIICDVMMPELDGYGVLHILNRDEKTAGIPFIFLTAKTEKADVRKGMDLGADDYLTKPFERTDLLNAIEARLKKALIHQRHYDITAEGLDEFINDAKKVLNLGDLCKDKKIRFLKKRTELFSEGDLPANIYFIKSGSIKVYQSHPGGKELITGIYNANDFFGFEPILEATNYQGSAVAMQDSEVISISKQDFITLLQSHPDVSRGFISLLCKKVLEKEKQLLNLAYNSVRQRTAEALLKVRDLKDHEGYIQISRDDLAKVVGTASESVIRVLSDFKDEGLVKIDSGGKFIITAPEKLEKIIRWNFTK